MNRFLWVVNLVLTVLAKTVNGWVMLCWLPAGNKISGEVNFFLWILQFYQSPWNHSVHGQEAIICFNMLQITKLFRFKGNNSFQDIIVQLLVFS
jgi:hypothetical protein